MKKEKKVKTATKKMKKEKKMKRLITMMKKIMTKIMMRIMMRIMMMIKTMMKMMDKMPAMQLINLIVIIQVCRIYIHRRSLLGAEVMIEISIVQ